MTAEEEFELLKEDYLFKTEVHVAFLRSVSFHEFINISTKARIALQQSDSSLSFLALSMFKKKNQLS